MKHEAARKLDSTRPASSLVRHLSDSAHESEYLVLMFTPSGNILYAGDLRFFSKSSLYPFQYFYEQVNRHFSCLVWFTVYKNHISDMFIIDWNIGTDRIFISS